MSEETKTPTAEDLERELPGFYDHEKVLAYQRCVIDLARHADVNLLEMLLALRNVLLAVQSKLAEKAGEIVVPESIMGSVGRSDEASVDEGDAEG